MHHVKQNHWKIYKCPLACDETFPSDFECKSHLLQSHSAIGPSMGTDNLIKLFSEPRDIGAGVVCPLCGLALNSAKQYQRHVGRHQEQLALFALPDLESSQGPDREEDGSVSADSEDSRHDAPIPKPNARQTSEVGHSSTGPDDSENWPAKSEEHRRRVLELLEKVAQSLQTSDDDPVETRPQDSSQNALLSQALRKADSAVGLDTNGDFGAAREAYSEACKILRHAARETDSLKYRADLNHLVSIVSTLRVSHCRDGKHR